MYVFASRTLIFPDLWYSNSKITVNNNNIKRTCTDVLFIDKRQYSYFSVVDSKQVECNIAKRENRIFVINKNPLQYFNETYILYKHVHYSSAIVGLYAWKTTINEKTNYEFTYRHAYYAYLHTRIQYYTIFISRVGIFKYIQLLLFSSDVRPEIYSKSKPILRNIIFFIFHFFFFPIYYYRNVSHF